MFNFTGTLSSLRVIFSPTVILPHSTVNNFNSLPVPVSQAFGSTEKGQAAADIRAVVLDKDNCFATPHSNVVYAEYQDKFNALKKAYPTTLLIVSNSSGLASADPEGHGAMALEASTGVPVLRHATPKPGCESEIMLHLRAQGITHPSQVAVVGDRLLTDVLMARRAHMWSIWTRDGVVEPKGLEGLIVSLEKSLATYLMGRGYEAPLPVSPFE